MKLDETLALVLALAVANILAREQKHGFCGYD